MSVLVFYATVEGQTGKIARFVKERVEALGHEAVLADADDIEAVSLEGVTAAILAAPVHQRRHPRHFEAVLAGLTDELAAIPTLLLSVSLSAAFPEGLEEAGEYLTEMEMRTGFTPTRKLLVAGAVRTANYDYFAMQVVRHVVLRDRDYDAAAGTHEFTDWEAIGREVEAFLESV